MPENTPDYRSKYYFFNVIKICCIFFVFFYHATKIFDADNWHIKNPVRGEIGSFFLLNLGMAVMPLFFLISGASVWFSIQKRSISAFILNIFKRFFLPLVFGFTILAWPQVYLERLSHGDYSGTLWSFFPHYFEGLYGLGGNFAWMGLHLWYLGMLFIFSIILIPLFFIGLKLFKRPFFQKLADNPLFLIVLAAITIYPGWKLFPGGLLGVRIWGGWNFAEHLFFFASGFFLFSGNNFIDKITNYRWGFLALAIVLTAAVLYWKFDDFQPKFRSRFFTFQVMLRSFACWSWMCAMLGINYRYFNVKRKAIDYLSKAVLPFYILNQPIMILIAFYVVHWDINNYAKFLLIAGGSLVLTMLLYELVRGLEVTRWLFGIPAKESVKRLNSIVKRRKKPGSQDFGTPGIFTGRSVRP
jgi:acyltransferase-like protein